MFISQDGQLSEGVARCRLQLGWPGVAEFMGGAASAKQCKDRWTRRRSKAQQDGVKQGNWSPEEVNKICISPTVLKYILTLCLYILQCRLLQDLVPQCVIKPHSSRNGKVVTKERVDWKAVGSQLNRFHDQCKNKWNRLQGRGRKNALHSKRGLEAGE